MNRGLRPVLDSIRRDGCPICGEQPEAMDVNGPDDIRLSCGHVIDAETWADQQYQKQLNEE